MQQIYPYFIKFHIIFSIIFLVTIVTITVYYAIRWAGKKEYGRLDNTSRRIYLALLYSDLLIGIILYFFLQKPDDIINTSEAMSFLKLRFWAIQHFSNVVFVTILCIIGNILIKKTDNSNKKLQYSFLYFGISTVVIIISVALFVLRK